MKPGGGEATNLSTRQVFQLSCSLHGNPSRKIFVDESVLHNPDVGGSVLKNYVFPRGVEERAKVG